MDGIWCDGGVTKKELILELMELVCSTLGFIKGLCIILTLQIYVTDFLIVAPVITPISVAPQVFAGETIQLNCFVSRGDSPVLISWFFNGEKLSMMGPLISTTQVGPLTSLLTINSATAWHSGNYSCVAGNRAGSTNYSVSLLVHGTCPLWLSMRKSMHSLF